MRFFRNGAAGGQDDSPRGRKHSPELADRDPLDMSASATARLSTRRPLPPRLSPLRRARRTLAVALALCLVPIAFSYGGMLAGASNSSFTIRSFEWLRDHGAAALASSIESVYYSWNAPATGTIGS